MTAFRIYIFLFSVPFSLFASSPTSLKNKKLSVSFSVSANSSTGTHEFHILNGVDVAGYYWKISNDPADVPDWSSERYNYRKTGNSTGSLTIINSSGEPTLLELSFTSSTTASCNLSFWSMINGELVKESYTGTATVSLTDLVLSDIPIEYQVAEPSGYFAPASIAAGILSAQDKYWSLYDETISFLSTGAFSASITNDDPSSPLSASGTSYTYIKTGTNSASLSYTIDGAGYSFEYDLQFTGENTGIYTKHADYTGGTTDVTTGPFSLSGVAVPEQFTWEDYENFSESEIDTDRWSLGHWDGGNLPVAENNKLTLTGNTISGFNEVLPTAGMLAFNAGIKPLLEESFAASNGSQSHSYLELLNDEDISGIEVEVQLPSDASTSTGIGLYASDWAKTFSEDQSENSFFGLDLRSDHIDIEYTDPNSGSLVSSELPTELGRSHIFAFIFEDQNVLLFVDGAKVAEFSSASFSRDSILIRAMNGAGESFSAYAQNIRVIRNWEDYDDFSDSSLDSSKWTSSNSYFTGNHPNLVNGQLELTGLTDQNPNNNTFLIFNDLEGILGVEADIWLPSNAPVDTGVLIGIADSGVPVGYLDLWADNDQTKFYVKLENSLSGESIEFTRSASLEAIYKVAIIKGEQKTALYLDGEKVAEVSTLAIG